MSGSPRSQNTIPLCIPIAISMFEAQYRSTSIKGGAHMHCVNSWTLDTYEPHPLAEVLYYGASKHSNVNEICKRMLWNFYTRLSHVGAQSQAVKSLWWTQRRIKLHNSAVMWHQHTFILKLSSAEGRAWNKAKNDVTIEQET